MPTTYAPGPAVLQKPQQLPPTTCPVCGEVARAVYAPNSVLLALLGRGTATWEHSDSPRSKGCRHQATVRIERGAYVAEHP